MQTIEVVVQQYFAFYIIFYELYDLQSKMSLIITGSTLSACTSERCTYFIGKKDGLSFFYYLFLFLLRGISFSILTTAHALHVMVFGFD
jgi:hypothetical protein